jgi:hypothetical protein
VVIVATQSAARVSPGVEVIAQAGGPTGATLAQSPGPVAESSGAPLSVTVPNAPSPGDLLVLFVVSASPIPVPTGFSTPISSVTPGPVQVFYQLAGASAPTSYSLGSATMLAQLFDVTGEDQTLVPTISVDSPVGSTTLVTRNESVLTPNGLTLAVFGGSSNTRLNWLVTPSPVSPSLQGGVTATAYPQTVYGTTNQVTNFGLALAVFQVGSEAFDATPNPFTVGGQFSQKVAFTGSAVYNGAVLTVLPAPSPTATTNLVTPPAGDVYYGVRYNELSGNNGTYDQSTIPNFETDIARTLAINSHFHYWTDIFPWANSTSNPVADSEATAPSIQNTGFPYNVPYDLANTDEEDDVVNGRYVLTTWNCGDTDWRVAHGMDDDQIIATAYRFKMYGQPIFVRYFHEMNLDSSSDDHAACLDGLASPNPTPSGYMGSSSNLSGDTTPNPGTSPTLGYFNYGEWKAAWIHVHNLVRSIAPNVLFVFVPSGGGMSDSSSFRPHQYYPGDEFVEWTGFDDYERRAYADFDDFTGGSPGPCGSAGPTPGPTYYCPNTIYSEVIDAHQYTQGAWTSPSAKPLFVAETAVTPASQPTWLASANPGDRSIIAETIGAIYPQIKALAYFDENGTINWTLTGAPPSPTPSLTPGTGYYLFTVLANDSQSASGPAATALPVPAATPYTINHGPLATSTGSPVTALPSAVPSMGDTLIAAVVTADQFSGSMSVPTGWVVLTSPPTSGGYLETAYCVVSAACPVATSYMFGTGSNGGMAQIFDIGKASSSATPAAAPDIEPTSFPTGLNTINELVRNLQISTTGGFTMTIWAANATQSVLNYPGSPGTNPLYEIYPSYAMLPNAVTPYTHKANMQVGSKFLSLATFRINREIASSSQPFTASARYYNNIPGIPGPAPTVSTGPVNGDGTIIWLHPAP